MSGPFDVFIKFVFYFILLVGVAVMFYYGITTLSDQPADLINNPYVISVTDLTVASIVLFVMLFAVFSSCYKRQSSRQEMPQNVQNWIFGTKWALAFSLLMGGVAIMAVTGKNFDADATLMVASLTVGIVYTFFGLMIIVHLLSTCKKITESGF